MGQSCEHVAKGGPDWESSQTTKVRVLVLGFDGVALVESRDDILKAREVDAAQARRVAIVRRIVVLASAVALKCLYDL